MENKVWQVFISYSLQYRENEGEREGKGRFSHTQWGILEGLRRLGGIMRLYVRLSAFKRVLLMSMPVVGFRQD